MTETIKIVGDNLTLDLILWRKHGLRGLALIEEAMKLNPDVENVVLPRGSEVILPNFQTHYRKNSKIVTLF